MKSITIFSFCVVLLSTANFASASTWARTYVEANRRTLAHSIEPTNDGGFLAAGVSYISPNEPASYDIALMKVDSSGNLQWRKTYGGSNKDVVSCARKTSDGGFLVVGTTRSFGAGIDDFWILKLDSSGNIQWQNTYGSSSSEVAFSGVQTPDGGFIVAGRTEAIGMDFWVLKLNSLGVVQWQRIYGYFNFGEFTASIVNTSDGGYILAGNSPVGGWQTMVLKLASNGDVQWQKSYQPGGVSLNDQPALVQQSTDGGYVILTQTWVNSIQGVGFLKVNSSGNLQWLKIFRLNNLSYIRDFDQTSDGGYIIAAMNSSSTNSWLLKLDSSANIQWQKTYGGNGLDDLRSIEQLTDGGYILAGGTSSYGSGSGDFWILKLDSSGSIDSSCNFINIVSTTPNVPTPIVSDTSIGMLGTFYNGQATSITPSSPSVNTLEQCSDSSCPLITLSPPALPAGVVGTPYSRTVSASGGASPYTFTVSSGALPTGLTLNSNSGLIGGTPTTVQTAAFQIKATDINVCTGVVNYTVDINDTCLFCDDFEDNGQPNWLITKPNFTEMGGSYVGAPTGRKAETIASPVFPGCSLCTVEVVMRTGGGSLNKVWLLLFYIDKNNVIELQMKEESDRWLLKQRVNKTIVAKAKGIATIDPNVDYVVTVTYDGTTINVSIDGVPLITMTPVGAPNGTVGFRVVNTTASFDSIVVN